ncbi:OsmC family protein [Anaerolineales bacterium HSG6]|nr:OsmC family protein [Anaerolineales bacterium HSG6]MDM8532925.1 OsmC family protein [Anaerolineales bacterium HSG25]
MGKTTVSANWTGEKLYYIGTDTKGNQVSMGGRNVSPGQMLLLGAAGCMGMDVVHVLRKKRQDVTDVQVQVTGYQPDEYPKPYQTVEINFTIKGNDLKPNAVERAIELSKNTYCVVGQTLKNPVELKTSYTIESA